ncbi:hypothetical protein [Feifania hominis]|uniref:Uncharacterized protein n=1 Tax=Feifania hominis TaxID=2763660 RepID=A0A926DFH3_9FIRM|nr:hypothetical protein [Feifania hominis]MBC8536892.1 hypothetical protein [Feifania hominis]
MDETNKSMDAMLAKLEKFEQKLQLVADGFSRLDEASGKVANLNAQFTSGDPGQWGKSIADGTQLATDGLSTLAQSIGAADIASKIEAFGNSAQNACGKVETLAKIGGQMSELGALFESGEMSQWGKGINDGAKLALEGLKTVSDAFGGDELASQVEEFGNSSSALFDDLGKLSEIGGSFATLGEQFQSANIGDWVVGVQQGIGLAKDSFSTLTDAFENGKGVYDSTKELIGGLATAFQNTELYQKLATAATTIWNGVSGIAATVTTALGAAFQFLTSPITLIVLGIAALVAVIVLVVKYWDEIKAAAVACWEKVKEIWGVVAQWFHDTIVEPIKEFFSGLWTGITDWATGAWNNIVDVWKKIAGWFQETVIDPVKNAFRGAMNFLISIAEGFVNGFISGINFIIRGLNKISFSIPDWVPLIGGNRFGFNLNEVARIEIPRLASGAVIQPNREFIAVLGDQRSGRNIETPEGLLRQIMQEELLSGRSAQDVNVNVYLDGKQITAAVEKRQRERGATIMTGGVYFA